MFSKSILAAVVIVVILVIGGGIYVTQQPPSTPVSTPTTTPEPAATTPAPTIQETPTSTPTPEPMETPEETFPGPTLPAGTDEEQVEALVMAYCDAYDRHDAEEVASCFTEDGSFMSASTTIGVKTGQIEIMTALEDFFNRNPDGTYQDLIIKGLSVSGDRANVVLQYKYIQAETSNVGWEENITAIRVGDTWRIQKSVSGYSVN